jgi:hypothetical protein
VVLQVLFPAAGTQTGWGASAGTLTVTLPRCPSACVLRLEEVQPSRRAEDVSLQPRPVAGQGAEPLDNAQPDGILVL